MLAGDTATLSSSPPASTFVIMLGGIDLSIQADGLAGQRHRGADRRPRSATPPSRSRCSSAPWPASLGGLAHVKLKHPVLHRHARRRRRAGRRRAGHLAGSARSRSTRRERGYLAWITGTRCRHPARGLHRRRRPARRPHRPEPHPLRPLQRRHRRRRGRGLRVGRQGRPAEDHRLRRSRAASPALAGVILAGRLASGSPTLANELLLPAIAAVVVGGTAITGGVGSIWRTLIGALIISVVRIGMTFRRRQHLRPADRLRRRADPGRRHHHRPQQDPDRQIEQERRHGSGSSRTRSR